MKSVNLSFLGDLSQEDSIMINKTAQWASLTNEKYMEKFSFFLDERQSDLCLRLLQSMQFDNYIFFGGYDGAKRAVLGLFPPYSNVSDYQFPVVPLTFTYRNNDVLTHRDFLGSLMALQIARETIGDIIVSNGVAVAFVYATVADFVVDNITKIGRVGVRVSKGFDENIIPIQEYLEICGTVASLRFDCVLSLALKLSREKASVLIKNGLAEVNHKQISSLNYNLSENDEFSVRGHGKFQFYKINGTSKKERIHITLKRYI